MYMAKLNCDDIYGFLKKLGEEDLQLCVEFLSERGVHVIDMEEDENSFCKIEFPYSSKTIPLDIRRIGESIIVTDLDGECIHLSKKDYSNTFANR